MRIGYPCINWSLNCKGNRTFRLASYTEDKLIETVENNLNCLENVLKYNVAHGFMFFRITSELVPFASHPICEFNWAKQFTAKFAKIGEFIRENDIRISMHPDQFTLLNSPKQEVVERSIAELDYHATALDAMNLDSTAKIQIHVGGVYNERENAMTRFIDVHSNLPDKISRRLVVENDDRNYPLKDCLHIHERTGIPVLFDIFHHRLLNHGEPPDQALAVAAATWNKNKDGRPMLDYSSQQPGERKGKHAEHIDVNDFQDFINIPNANLFDIMLEIKDKEKSASLALERIRNYC